MERGNGNVAWKVQFRFCTAEQGFDASDLMWGVSMDPYAEDSRRTTPDTEMIA